MISASKRSLPFNHIRATLLVKGVIIGFAPKPKLLSPRVNVVYRRGSKAAAMLYGQSRILRVRSKGGLLFFTPRILAEDLQLAPSKVSVDLKRHLLRSTKKVSINYTPSQ